MAEYPDAIPVHSPVKGQVIWQIDTDDMSMAPQKGTEIKGEDPFCFIQTYYGMEEICPDIDGRIIEVCARQGESVVKGEIIALLLKNE